MRAVRLLDDSEAPRPCAIQLLGDSEARRPCAGRLLGESKARRLCAVRLLGDREARRDGSAARSSSRLHAALPALAVVLAACSDKPAPTRAPRIGNVLAAVLAAADETREPWRCAAADLPNVADLAFTTGDRKWQLGGHMLRRTDHDDAIAIGVIADAANASPRTIAALARLRVELEKASPDLVLTLGGMGSTQAELEATLGTLAERAPWPLVALPGDLEGMPAYVGAVSALRKRGEPVVDGRLVRWIELPGATVATLPGAGARERLAAADDGCQWRPEDVAKVYSDVTAKPGMRIVASAEAPRTTVGGEPAGELALVPAQPIEVALHGPVSPAPSPARTGIRDGMRAVLSPGTSDAVRRLPDPHTPSAGVLVIRSGVWSWRPVLVGK